MTKTIFHKEFEEKYLPLLSKAKKAMDMPKSQFWHWYLELPEKEAIQIKRIMLGEANLLLKKAEKVFDYFGY